MTDVVEAAQCPFTAPESLEERIRRYSVYQPWLQADPIPYFKELRDHAPYVWSDELGGFWIVTRYEEIEWVARNPEIFSNTMLSIPPHDVFKDKAIPIQLDGDEHRKWRRALSSLFNPSTVNHFSPQIRQATIDTIEPLVEKGTCEFISEVAVKLPAEAFLITFGIGREYLDQILEYKEWLRQEMPKANNEEEVVAASEPLWRFFREAIARRRAEGTSGRRDVLSGLLNTTFDGRTPTDEEMANVAFMNMLAAFDTTTAAISVIFAYLAGHQEAQELVIGSPEKIPTVVEELLRYDPVSSTARMVVKDVERHGVTMRKGDMVLMPWAMAGRDPEVFEDPDKVDFDRTGIRHLVFAVGPHRCLGMHLSRRVIKTVIEEWHARVPRYRVREGTTPTRYYTTVRGLSSLELSWPPASESR
jgi:cytochrome P450